jgi:hypothetical protein
MRVTTFDGAPCPRCSQLRWDQEHDVTVARSVPRVNTADHPEARAQGRATAQPELRRVSADVPPLDAQR